MVPEIEPGSGMGVIEGVGEVYFVGVREGALVKVGGGSVGVATNEGVDEGKAWVGSRGVTEGVRA
jgi:hypothetical protein